MASNSISINFQSHLPYAMDPPSSSSSFSLNFQQPYLYPQQQQQQQQQQATPSPRPLQGPRPAHLKVDKKSHKIRKPPAGPAAATAAAPAAAPSHPQPVIIYAVSPKVFRTKPSDFMALVQRLTGVNSSSTAVEAAASPPAFPSPSGAPSPAARLATIEQAQRLPDSLCPSANELDLIVAGSGALTRPGSFVGILSPNPATLPPVSPGLFSAPAPEINSLGFLQDMIENMSPSGRGGFADSSFLLSPLGFSVTPTAPSPIWEYLMNSPLAPFPFPPDL